MAAFFWIHAGANNNWNTVNNWSATSGGGTNAATPSVTSDVTFDGAGANGNDASTVSAAQSVLSLTFTAGYTNTVTISNAVNITIAGNFTDHANHSWTVNGTGGMIISAASTITSGGKTFPGPVGLTNTNTKTLSGNWTITGTLTCTGVTTLNRTTAETITVGGLTMSNSCTGTAGIIMSGGTWQSAGVLQNSLTIAGNVTFGNVTYNTGTLTYSSGTITANGTVTVAASTTWNTSGISFTNITFSANGTHTINSLLTVSGTMQVNNSAAITFAGTSGFYVNSFSAVNTTAATHTFKNGVTYTIYGFFLSYLAPNSGGNIFTSDDGTARTNIVLLNASAQCQTNGRFTRVDASGGRPIVSFNGTITDCINVVNFTTVLSRPVQSYDRNRKRFNLSNKNRSVIYQ